MSSKPNDGAQQDVTDSDSGTTVTDTQDETEEVLPAETEHSHQDVEGDEDDVIPDLENVDERALVFEEQGEANTSRQRPEQLQLVEEAGSDDATLSIPDDTPSVQGSILSSPRSGTPSIKSTSSRLGPSTSHRPFDRRFQTRLSSSPLRPSRPSSPALLGAESRRASVSSVAFPTAPEQDPASAPWDVIRWARLRKLSAQAFSEIGKRNFGRPTCMAISTSIVIGTTKGIALVFDYQQNPKGVIGPGTKAVECGPVTSLAISADHSTIAVGHATGNIFTWELARPARPFLHVQPLPKSQAQVRKSDGHLEDVSVLHIGFLGTRHTAVVSADDRGMAFSHLATRGMGAVGRIVRSTRILGRYPELITRSSKLPRPSSVLAFSPLPLGNVEQSTDSMGLVAMMTPYLLVIVSTTPVAQTQYKTNRPKEVAAHSAMSAALAWFPSIKLKAKEGVSKTKLVYCWSNVLSVLEISEISPSEASEKERPPEFRFRVVARWTAEEAIVAVQWLSRSVLAVLTISQQLLIIEDATMTVTDSFDLIQRHVYHNDLFSTQLHSLVESLDEENEAMHGVVADAFFMSFRAYKGRLFLLGHNDVSIGSLTNWADRLLAMIEAGDFIGAIRLATSYYDGHGEKITIGLPEDDDARHSVVQEKLLEMISASIKYAFGRNPEAGSGQLEKPQLVELAEACLIACDSMDEEDFLFDEVFAAYEEKGEEAVFLDVLEPYIVEGKITTIPPTAVKALIEHYRTNHTPSSLEEIICQLNPLTMDIEQVTTLCKTYNLYDAYIYVWTRTLQDFTSPLKELLATSGVNGLPNGGIEKPARDLSNIAKMFPYLSYTLTGRIYPTGDLMEETEALKAKTQVYVMLFFEASEPESQDNAATRRKNSGHVRRSFPTLSSILQFDTSSFMSVLNEAFEDSFLNDTTEQQRNGALKPSNSDSGIHRHSINRQYLVNVLLKIMTEEDFEPDDTIYLDMFLARNLPKYPQYVMLRGTVLHQILTRLCHPPDEDMQEDCQLSVEYLLSVYHPTDTQVLVRLLKSAQFYRVLKSVYRAEQLYSDWIETYFLDVADQEDVFNAIRECLREGSTLTAKQKGNVQTVMSNHTDDLISIDIVKTAETIDALAKDMQEIFVNSLDGEPQNQYKYLRALFNGHDGKAPESIADRPSTSLVERYVQLMCRFEPFKVADYVDTISVSGLHIDSMLSAMEEGGVIDAAVVLLARQGQVKDAMNRLVRHLGTLEAALLGILENANEDQDLKSTEEAVANSVNSMEKYTRVGIWLCKGQTQSARRTRTLRPTKKGASALTSTTKNQQQPLTTEEELWLGLINAVVNIPRVISPGLTKLDSNVASPTETPQVSIISSASVWNSLRSLIQSTFTALLTVTTSSTSSPSSYSISFLSILRTFLAQQASLSPTLSSLRQTLSSIFTAYAYEETLLKLANGILETDLWGGVEGVVGKRGRGWRPRGQACGGCGRRVWGVGVGGGIWGAWEEKEMARRAARDLRRGSSIEEGKSMGRGKGKATDTTPDPAPRERKKRITAEDEDEDNNDDEREEGEAPADQDQDQDENQAQNELSAREKDNQRGNLGPVVVFSCRHLYHQSCLLDRRAVIQQSMRDGGSGEGTGDQEQEREEMLVCPVCMS
ncbi:MAG: hypothetical protein Q9227_008542 [Pyrenula ochraceoflavens]